MKRLLAVPVLAVALSSFAPQDPRAPVKVDPKKVNEAIDKGAAFLIKE